MYSVISVIDKRLPGNTKKWAIAPFVDDQSAISRILGGYMYTYIHMHVHTQSTCMCIYIYIHTRTQTHTQTHTSTFNIDRKPYVKIFFNTHTRTLMRSGKRQSVCQHSIQARGRALSRGERQVHKCR